MLDDIIIQMLSTTPRRPLSVWGILSGRKTASVLFAGLEYGILQWRNLVPHCNRERFLQVITNFSQRQLVVVDGPMVALTSRGVKAQRVAAEKLPLPTDYQYANQPLVFADRLFLAVQVVSEAEAQNKEYVPVTADWQVQQWVRGWYRQWAGKKDAVVDELERTFTAMPQDLANYLAQQFVGHGYNGQMAPTLSMTLLASLSALLRQVAAQADEFPALASLWGGPVSVVAPKAIVAANLLKQGQDLPAIAGQMRRKLSTINEYVQEFAILVDPIAPEVLAQPAQIAALNAAWTRGERGYQQLLQAASDLQFMQVRLFQIWQLQKEAAERG